MGYSKTTDAAGRELTIEQVQELYQFLQGEDVGEITTAHRPKLSSNKAFTVIYFLQERMNLLPDRFERCCRCGDIFDDLSEGWYDSDTGRAYCGNCYG